MKKSDLLGVKLIIFCFASLFYSTRVLADELIPVEINNSGSSPNSPVQIYVPQPEVNSTPELNSSPVCSSSPDSFIEQIIGPDSNKWGILVETLQDGNDIYVHNADRHFIPASNVKLFTTAAALQRLNPDSPIHSTTVKDWITFMNLRSDNDYAETLSRYIGGVNEEIRALSQLGLNPNSYHLVDGSGLSHDNQATPRAIVSTLRAMYFSPNGRIFENSLPIAGISGTLRNRMKLSPAEGRVHAKTGTLTGVRALSGYIENPQSGTLVFSILVNRLDIDGDQLKHNIDQIAIGLSAWIPCTLK